ncbi:MAG: hypothetical protein ACFFCW_01885 [Candidatus Hodarchaeota archaeon]
MSETEIKQKKKRGRPMKRREIPLTGAELTFWTLVCCGMSITDASKEVDVSKVTGYRWVEELQKHMGNKVDIDAYRMQSARLWPLALDSLRYHLANKDPYVTVQWLKGHGLFADTLNLVAKIDAKEAARRREIARKEGLKRMGIDYIDITPEVVDEPDEPAVAGGGT